jgi:hypothetical protein
MAVTSELTTGNLAPTVPSFEVMSVNSVRCAASDETACNRAQQTHVMPDGACRDGRNDTQLQGRTA